jgi:predicted transcriptional regulator
MTSTAPNDGTKVKVLIDRLAQGQNLTVDARRAQYKLSLDGFSTAAQQLVACRQQMASRQQGTVGERQ